MVRSGAGAVTLVPLRFYLTEVILPNLKISAAADIGTPLASDMLPLARSGDANGYHVTMAEISAFASATVASGAYNNVGRNLLHNPQFIVGQRGTGPWVANAVYTADRWQIVLTTDTVSVATVALADTDRAAIGDETAIRALQNTFTGNAATGAFNYIRQPIEHVWRMSGKTVTVSFWAVAASGTPKIGVNAQQFFGTGGSPSASVQALATGLSATLSTTWARYSVTIAMPSIAGKTLGTNGDDHTALQLWYSSGATNNATAGNIGVQSGTISLWGIQLEVGSTATPLEKLEYAEQVLDCMRFYQIGVGAYQGYGAAGGVSQLPQPFSVYMRATPVVSQGLSAGYNYTAGTPSATNTGIVLTANITALGGFGYSFSYTASADL